MANPGAIIIRLIITGTQIFGRAFIDAYRVAKIKSAQNQALRGARDPRSTTQQSTISVSEAYRILNLNPGAGIDELRKRYGLLHSRNDPAKGGSPYLQAKIQAAKNRIEEEMKDAGGSNPK